jgi:hypothetical protein
MDPVAVSIDVPSERADVYTFLDVLANHESFTDHMLRDWSCSGPSAGVGARAQVTSVIGGRRELQRAMERLAAELGPGGAGKPAALSS